MPDSFEHMPPVAVRMPNGALALLAGNVDPHHSVSHHQKDPEVVQIRVSKEAPEELVEECGHPKHAPLHLMVTPISGCDGFEPAKPN